jgi:hypothetical protein
VGRGDEPDVDGNRARPADRDDLALLQLFQNAWLVEIPGFDGDILARGLRGRLTGYASSRQEGAAMELFEAVLHDERFVYRAQLHTSAALRPAALSTFMAMATSTQPVPHPRSAVDTVIHQMWND